MTHNLLEDILINHPFFEGFTKNEVHHFLDYLIFLQFKPGQYVFRQSEDANYFYLIRDGQISLEMVDMLQQTIPIQILEKNEVLGWSWFYPPYQWTFDAQALTFSELIALDGQYIRNKCNEDHDFGYKMMHRISELLIQRLQSTRKHIWQIQT